MSDRQQPRPPLRWQPTWRRVAGGSVGVFVVLVAFMAGRMRAGEDPGLTSSKSSAGRVATRTQTAPSSASSTQDTSASQAQTSDPNPPTTHSS